MFFVFVIQRQMGHTMVVSHFFFHSLAKHGAYGGSVTFFFFCTLTKPTQKNYLFSLNYCWFSSRTGTWPGTVFNLLQNNTIQCTIIMHILAVLCHLCPGGTKNGVQCKIRFLTTCVSCPCQFPISSLLVFHCHTQCQRVDSEGYNEEKNHTWKFCKVNLKWKTLLPEAETVNAIQKWKKKKKAVKQKQWFQTPQQKITSYWCWSNY